MYLKYIVNYALFHGSACNKDDIIYYLFYGN